MKPLYAGSAQFTVAGPLNDTIFGFGTGVIAGVAGATGVAVGAAVGGASVTLGALGAELEPAPPPVATAEGAADEPPLGVIDAAGVPPSTTTRIATNAIAARATPAPMISGWIGTTTFGGGGGAPGSATTA